MAKWKAGDRVRVVSRPVTEDDRKSNQYFEHMAGLVGMVEYLYEGKMVSVKIDPDSPQKTTMSPFGHVIFDLKFESP